MVGLKGKIYYGVLCNISILCYFVLDGNKIVLAVYAVLMLYYIYVIVIYDGLYVRNIMYYNILRCEEYITTNFPSPIEITQLTLLYPFTYDT